MIFTGTNHFVSHEAAMKYYGAQTDGAEAVVEWYLAEGLICFGPPPLKEGESLILENGLRYIIKSSI